MDNNTLNLERKIFPRWRSYRTTIQSQQLQSTRRIHNNRPPIEDFLLSKKAMWMQHPTTHLAADIVGSGRALNRENEVLEHARFLLQPSSNASQWMREIAQSVIAEASSENSHLNETVSPQMSPQQRYSRIRKYRSWLRSEPKDPITWTDLSLEYTILGNSDKSSKCMNIALQLAPCNRFVVRSASRLWIHHADLERAKWTLLKSLQISLDPWLLAAEIAVSDALNMRSLYIKKARHFVADDALSNFHISELASALATVELTSGSKVKSRRLFKQSLLDPTENSVAQLVWASRIDRRLSMNFNLPSKVKNLFEAKCRRLYWNNEWDGVLSACKSWKIDEPYSITPRLFGSHIAAVVQEDYETSKELIGQQEFVDYRCFELLNNLAFSEINLGNLGEADSILRSAQRVADEDKRRSVWLATKGLLEYRQGSFDDGRKLYQDSQDLARKLPEDRILRFSLAFNAIEEAKCCIGGESPKIEEARKLLSKDLGDPVFRVLLDRLEKKVLESKFSSGNR